MVVGSRDNEKEVIRQLRWGPSKIPVEQTPVLGVRVLTLVDNVLNDGKDGTVRSGCSNIEVEVGFGKSRRHETAYKLTAAWSLLGKMHQYLGKERCCSDESI